jgi:hypothetical protein
MAVVRHVTAAFVELTLAVRAFAVARGNVSVVTLKGSAVFL